ncbi:hypothetical protein SIPHO014v1_p0043 [Vibrio phage 82E32.3]|nr:hypothetical protein SIPHO014v1_p0043 [Vibrio phage 82E32.3]
MNKVDTNYESLDQIDPEIARFYAEDVRTRLVSRAGVGDEPATQVPEEYTVEEYTVIVLMVPSEVTYEYVQSRYDRRHNWEVIKAAIEDAIAWEGFSVNHEGYLAWKSEHSLWISEQPTEVVDEAEVLLPEPVRPVIDMANRRAVYKSEGVVYDHAFHIKTGETETYNDETYTKLITPVLEPRPDADIAELHSELAIDTRYNSVYEPLPFGDKFIDVGRGKDGVLGIDNVKDALSAYDTGLNGVDTAVWIMSDNSVQEMSIADLKQVIVDFNARKQIVFMQYSEWRTSDRLTKFEVTK